MSSDKARLTEPRSARKLKRRWLQFSLRALLVLFVLAAGFFNWVHTEIVPARKQRLAAQAIVEGGGSVNAQRPTYDGESPPILNRSGGNPPPTWWTKLLGEDPRVRARFVSLGELQETPMGFLNTVPRKHTSGDHNLQFVSDLRGVETLDAMGRTVTDEGLMQVRELPELKALYLRHASLTRKGLSVLRRAPKLEFLQMKFCPVTDEVFTEIGQAKMLKHLDMTQAHITGESLHALTALVDLETLILDEVDFNGVGLGNLAELPRLTRLSLVCTSVNDEGAVAIAQITALQDLNLNATPITDAGLIALAKLPNLLTLTVGSKDQCRYTPKGLQVFRDTRPDVAVNVSYCGTFNPAWLRSEWAKK